MDCSNDNKMEIEKKRVAPVIQKQKEMLTEFLQNHENLRTGKFSNEFTKKKARELWEEVTGSLNAIGGSKKTWVQWRKTWQDMKKNVKAKAVAEKRYATGTGGGPIKIIKFDETETKILSILSPTATFGDLTVPVPNVEFEFEGSVGMENQENIELSNIEEIQESRDIVAENSTLSTECKNYVAEGNSARRIPTSKNRFVKGKRLDNSIAISNNLVKIEEEKKEMYKSYMEEKKMYLIWRREYENEKLLHLKRAAESQEKILKAVENLKYIFLNNRKFEESNIHKE